MAYLWMNIYPVSAMLHEYIWVLISDEGFRPKHELLLWLWRRSWDFECLQSVWLAHCIDINHFNSPLLSNHFCVFRFNFSVIVIDIFVAFSRIRQRKVLRNVIIPWTQSRKIHQPKKQRSKAFEVSFSPECNPELQTIFFFLGT